MKLFWQQFGQLVFWLSLPALRIYLGHRPRTRLLVVSGNRLLVTKGWLSDGRWSLPGGGLHRHETALSGARRELAEETGIILPAEDLQQVGEYSFKQHGLSFDYYLFLARVNSLLPLQVQHFEIVEAKWLDKSQLMATKAGPDVLQALQHWPTEVNLL